MAPYVWLITGTSSGLGRQLVFTVLAKGDLVIATARTISKIQNLDKLPQFPEGKIDNLRLLELDLDWSEEKLEEAVKQSISYWGRIDVLVNNGGVAAKCLVEEASSKSFKRQYQTNLFGVVDLTNAVLPHMRAKKFGTIVMIGSRRSWSPELPNTGLYASSKAALRVYTETLASELSALDLSSIHILLIEPGAFRTNSIAWPPYENDRQIAEYDELREKCMASMNSRSGSQPGDPEKGMSLLVDVVKEEGKGKGKWDGRSLIYLPIGKDSVRDIKWKCGKMLEAVEEWEQHANEVDF